VYQVGTNKGIRFVMVSGQRFRAVQLGKYWFGCFEYEHHSVTYVVSYVVG